MVQPRFQGILTALITPFRADGSVDLEAYRALIESQIEAGIEGLVPCGTTGEAATLSPEEHLLVVRTCVEQVKRRVPVIAGAGANATARAIDLHRQIAELGVDGALHVTPWYNKPTQEGLYRHFRSVAEASPLPVMLYNVPSRTGVDLAPETVFRLVRELPQVVAIKEATGSVSRAQELLAGLADLRPDFAVLSGEDGFILPLLAMGGHGVVSVISHLCASELVAMRRAFLAGDHTAAQRIAREVNPLVSTLFFRANPIPVKTALAMRGQCEESFRLPLCPLAAGEKEELQRRLTEAGFGD